MIPTEGTGSPEPLIGLANRLARMTDWSALSAATGIDELSPRVRRRTLAKLDRFNCLIRLESGAQSVSGKALMRLRRRWRMVISSPADVVVALGAPLASP